MIYEILLQPFTEYNFMRRALVACIALSISGAPIGIFLILRRMTLIGDTMSHAILPGIAIAFLIAGTALWPMTIGGLIAGLLIALFAGLISRITTLKEDASFTGAYLISLATGVTVISIKGNSVDLTHVLFGNVLAVDNQALILIVSISSLSLTIMSLIYRSLIIECFDSNFMRTVKGKGAFIHQLFLVLLVLNLVCAFQALGTLMALGIIILPAISAKFWTRNIDVMVILSICFAICSSYIGLLISYHYNMPSGSTIVLTQGCAYLLSLLTGSTDSLRTRFMPQKHYAG